MDITTGARLASLRKENGYSQETLAEKLNISRQAVSKWERGESSPDTDNLILLASLYSMSLDELLGMSADNAENEQQAAVCPEMPEAAPEAAAQAGETAADAKPLKSEKKARKKKISFRKERIKKPALFPALSHGLLIFPFPLLLGAAYVGLSYYTGKWHPLWLMTTLIPVYYWFAFACRAKTKRGFLLGLPVLPLTALSFLAIGILTAEWIKALPLFIIVPVYYWFAAAYGKERGKNRGDGKRE